jgi:LysR family transcriptional regulator of gallate degradation
VTALPRPHDERPDLPTAPPDLRGQLGNLRTFLQVAQAKSMADAGRALFKSSAVVSRAMRELECVVGGMLFERTSRGVMLNDRGRTVLARVQRIDQELSQAAAEVARLRPQALAEPDALREPLYDGKRLSVITYLVDRGAVSLAAGTLGMTQSGVSMALSRTEAALGVQLFTRSPHGLVPLPATCRIVVHAKRAFAELRHLSSDLASAGGRVTGVVSIGTLPLGRTQVVPMAIAEATAFHPALRITTVESHYEQLIGGLQSGEVDVVIGVPRDGGADLQTEYLFDDRLAVLARSGHPLQSASSIALADIAGERWILPRPPSRSRRLLTEAFEQERLAPPVPVVESADLAIVRHLLMAGDALALASVRQFSFELAVGLLEELPVALPGMSRPVALILRHGAAPSVAVSAIVDALRHQAASELAAIAGNRERGRRETSVPDVLSGDSALRRGDGVETPGSRTPTVVDGVISATDVATSAR